MTDKLIIWVDSKPVEVSTDHTLIPSFSGSVTDQNEYTVICEGLLIWKTARVECQICKEEWIADYPEGTQKLECPNCRNMTEIIIIEIDDH
jgi:hypothetical protein